MKRQGDAGEFVGAPSSPPTTITTTESASSPDDDGLKRLEAAKFSIRTSNRRHLDFEQEFDLDDAEAEQRVGQFKEPFYFIQAADSQFGMIDSYIHSRPEPGWREEVDLCNQLVDKCNRMVPRPKFLIICGDLIDSLPASELGQRQMLDFKSIFQRLKIPLVCVCGNHDIGDEPTEESLRAYRRQFGEDYFYFTLNGVLFIVINSQFYKHRLNLENYAREQDSWLDGILKHCKKFTHTFVFEHIPWFLENANEPDDYFNINKDIRNHWLEKFYLAGVTKIFCGHYHRNAGGHYKDMELVVTSAIGAQMGEDASGVRLVRITRNKITHDYYPMERIPLEVELGGDGGPP